MPSLPRERVQQTHLEDRKGRDAIFNSSYLDDIPAALASWDSKRVLLVVSKALDSTTDKISMLEHALGDVVVDKKCGVGRHSPYPDVIDIAKRIQDLHVDCVVCIGSSSYSDACKIGVLLQATLLPGFTADDMEGLVDQVKGVTDPTKVKISTVKLVLVPTSLSASEWNSVSSCTNDEGKKQHFGRWDAGAADLILLAPPLALTAPEDLWVSSGFRAVDHCVEVLCNPASDEYPEVEKYVCAGLAALLRGLSGYKDGKRAGDEEVLLKGISDCQRGARDAMMGLVAWRIPLGPSHAIGHQLGSVTGIMHGLTSSIMLAPVLRYSRAQGRGLDSQEKLLKVFNEVLGWEEKEVADAVERLAKFLELPTKLSEVGVTEDAQVNEIADKAMEDVWGGGKRQMERAEIMTVLEMAR